MRKLATIQRVKEVMPVLTVDGREAENLVLITFCGIGWQCVARKGEFQPDDLAVYIEISTILPDHPVFEFMRAKKFKVKTVRFLKTTVSQGLVLPTNILKDFIHVSDDELFTIGEGDDVTLMLGVTRYDPEALDNRTGGEQAGPFPVHILPKTDQERLQSSPFLLDRMKTVEDVIATLKIDGTSSTYYFDDDVLHACGRNIEHRRGNGSVYWKIAEKYGLEEILRQQPHIAIQGEIAAPGIQKNLLGLRSPELFIFGVWDRRTNSFMPYHMMRMWCSKCGLQCVPAVRIWNDGEFSGETLETLLELAKGKYNGTNNAREGIVVRPLYESLFDHRLGAELSFKVINNDYLLGGGE